MSEPTVGDPVMLSEQVKRAGIEGVLDNMMDGQRALAIASGCVSDHRRLVAFIYLVLRDNMVAGRFGAVMRMYASSIVWDPTRLVNLSFDGVALRLSRSVGLPVMRAWLQHLTHQSLRPEQLAQLVDMLPEDDDTSTVYSNGWLGLYAIHVADELEAHGPS